MKIMKRRNSVKWAESKTMLILNNIIKDYKTGAEVVHALKGVNIVFRKNEFVSILGHSGCGKTTLLNIIGGLDRYTHGDLFINGVSTKKYKDRDWDTYRNHSIGFVFQSYNLISHQSVLSNVELALTVSGVSAKERKKRAYEALEKVGLKGQEKKRPNQLSGGQMQRVAIARALINNPEILLADEPTGALDTDTSEQVMEILKEVAKDRLVIMVTHNPELAEKYSTRIIRLSDGLVKSDSDPFSEEDEAKERIVSENKNEKDASKGKKKKSSMSFLTAAGLSLNNLMTKKTRTILTSVAGSVGIIGIALILALSTGVKNYIDQIQRETLASYPITLQKEMTDISALLGKMSESSKEDENTPEHELDAIYQNHAMVELVNMLNSAEVKKNNLSSFKKYIEENKIKEEDYISSIQYNYNLKMNVYSDDGKGNIFKADVSDLFANLSSLGKGDSSTSMMSGMLSTYSQTGISVWNEMLSGKNGELVSDIVKEQYDLVGNSKWPENYNEVVLVVNERNEISDFVLYSLGLVSSDDLFKQLVAAINGEQIEYDENAHWSYEEILSKTFTFISPADNYIRSGDVYTDTEGRMLQSLYSGGEKIKIVGIIRPSENAEMHMLSSGTICYTSALAEKIISITSEKDAVISQLNNKDTDIFTGLPFKTGAEVEPSTEEKAALIKEYIKTLDAIEKSEIFMFLASTPDDEKIERQLNEFYKLSREEKEEMIIAAYAGSMGVEDVSGIKDRIATMTDTQLDEAVAGIAKDYFAKTFADEASKMFAGKTAEELAGYLDAGLESTDAKILEKVYDEYMPKTYSESTYDENLAKLGYIDLDSPFSINLYASTFENKDSIADLIDRYNAGVKEDDKIEYTDYIAILLSSITTIINAISYVLIAFVSISLVVSSLMIGVITYISVLERTKEIGILRAIGASKRNVSNVFNAETLLIGFFAGVIGIAFTLILCIPINLIIRGLTGIPTLGASLPVGGAIALIIISVVLTVIAGLIPASTASKCDPVVALRTE